MKIHEIFYSIQGEGKCTGMPTIFIRTTGCNLRCSYCDTTYAYTQGMDMDISEIVDYVNRFKCSTICLTGGEPLIQEEIFLLLDKLLEKNYFLSIETNGSIDIKKITKKKNLTISLDIKCPSSKMHEQMQYTNILHLENNDQLKFIIKDNKDYEYAKKILKEYPSKSTIFFQPVWGTNIKDLVSWILNDHLNIRLGVQLHKIIWGDKKGV
ncbi:MAG: radical SAM protein [Thermoplasmatota archaeon]